MADFDGTLAVGARDPAVAVIEPRRAAWPAGPRAGGDRATRARPRRGPDRAGRVGRRGPRPGRWRGIPGRPWPRARHAGARRARGAPAGRHGSGLRRATATRRRAWPTPWRDELGSPPWLFVERKGPSVAFHVRQADDVVAARAAVVAAIATVEAREGLRDHGLAHYRGRSVVDLRPAEAGGKREAVERLLERHRPRRRGRPGRRDERRRRVRGGHRVPRPADPRALAATTVAVHGATKAAPDELLRRRRPVPRLAARGRSAAPRPGATSVAGRRRRSRLGPAQVPAMPAVPRSACAACSTIPSSAVGNSPRRIVSDGRRREATPHERAVALRRCVARGSRMNMYTTMRR